MCKPPKQVSFQDSQRISLFAAGLDVFEEWHAQPKLSFAKLAPRIWISQKVKEKCRSIVGTILLAIAIKLVVELVWYMIKKGWEKHEAKTMSASLFQNFAAGVYEVEE